MGKQRLQITVEGKPSPRALANARAIILRSTAKHDGQESAQEFLHESPRESPHETMSGDNRTLCPCGSGREDRLCCVVDIPPLVQQSFGYKRIDLEAAVVLRVGGREYPAHAYGVRAEATFRSPLQTDPEVRELIERVLRDVSGAGVPPSHLQGVADRLGYLDDSLHAVRYHQRQFLYRLRAARLHQMFVAQPPRGNVDIEIDDLPMRYELESLVVGARTSLDALAKAAFAVLGKNKKSVEKIKWGEFSLNERTKGTVKTQLTTILVKHAEWLSPIKRFRDPIIHDANFDTYRGPSFQWNAPSSPEVDGKAAESFAYTTWHMLLQLVGEVLSVACSGMTPEG